MIKADNLKFTWGLEPIFSGVDFLVNNGEKVGIVGANGSGKTTLFKIISGVEQPDDGRIQIDGQVVFVPQEVKEDDAMDSATDVYHYLNSQNFPEYHINRILSGLGLTNLSFNQQPSTFSGGQKTRLALAKAILQQPKILLLDEPTNFLDQDGKKWVANFIAKYPGTILIISHDIPLLSQSLNKIFYLNPQTKKIDSYSGSYQAFLDSKSEKEQLLIRQIENTQKKIKKMKQSLIKMARFSSDKGVRSRLNVQHRLESLQENLPPLPPVAKKIQLQLPPPLWIGQLPIFTKNISKSFGQHQVLKDVNLTIKRGQKTALIGQNGAGKSTLIKILMGELSPTSGEIVRDDKLKIGYYCQELTDLNPLSTVVDIIRQVQHGMTDENIRSLLGKMLFSGDKVFQLVGKLSGGEKTRLSIARLLAQDFNLLILDEPTTYLDPLSQRLILDSLKAYQGALIIVSHNQQFLDELNLDQRLYLPENKIVIKYN